MLEVLITGGAGYLGSVITSHLLNEGYKVTCLDNLSFGQDSLRNFASDKNFRFLYGDVRDVPLLKKIVPRADVIIPLAAIVGMPACLAKPVEAQEINFNSIVSLSSIRRPEQRVIYPTTNSGYGTKSGAVFCTEDTPLEPISLYGQTKVEAERHLLEEARIGKPAITLRLATVFGTSPRMRTDLLVNDFVLRAMRDGRITIYEKDFKRNFVHIGDVARCFEHCIANFDSMKNQAYNVGLDSANVSKAELAEAVKRQVPKFEIVYDEIGKDPDKRNYVVSNNKLLSTGFRPIHSLDEGIGELITWYAQYGFPTKGNTNA